jgi:hypothetical protein
VAWGTERAEQTRVSRDVSHRDADAEAARLAARTLRGVGACAEPCGALAGRPALRVDDAGPARTADAGLPAAALAVLGAVGADATDAREAGRNGKPAPESIAVLEGGARSAHSAKARLSGRAVAPGLTRAAHAGRQARLTGDAVGLGAATAGSVEARGGRSARRVSPAVNGARARTADPRGAYLADRAITIMAASGGAKTALAEFARRARPGVVAGACALRRRVRGGARPARAALARGRAGAALTATTDFARVALLRGGAAPVSPIARLAGQVPLTNGVRPSTDAVASELARSRLTVAGPTGTSGEHADLPRRAFGGAIRRADSVQARNERGAVAL